MLIKPSISQEALNKHIPYPNYSNIAKQPPLPSKLQKVQNSKSMKIMKPRLPPINKQPIDLMLSAIPLNTKLQPYGKQSSMKIISKDNSKQTVRQSLALKTQNASQISMTGKHQTQLLSTNKRLPKINRNQLLYQRSLQKKQNLDDILNVSACIEEQDPDPTTQNQKPVKHQKYSYLQEARHYKVEDLKVQKDDSFYKSTKPEKQIAKCLNCFGGMFTAQNVDYFKNEAIFVVQQDYEILKRTNSMNEVIYLGLAMLESNLEPYQTEEVLFLLNKALIDVLSQKVKMHNMPKVAMRYFMITFSLIEEGVDLPSPQTTEIIKQHLKLFQETQEAPSEIRLSLFNEFLRIVQWILRAHESFTEGKNQMLYSRAFIFDNLATTFGSFLKNEFISQQLKRQAVQYYPKLEALVEEYTKKIMDELSEKELKKKQKLDNANKLEQETNLEKEGNQPEENAFQKEDKLEQQKQMNKSDHKAQNSQGSASDDLEQEHQKNPVVMAMEQLQQNGYDLVILYEEVFKLSMKQALFSWEDSTRLNYPEQCLINEFFGLNFLFIQNVEFLNQKKLSYQQLNSLFDRFFKYMTNFSDPADLENSFGDKIIWNISNWEHYFKADKVGNVRCMTNAQKENLQETVLMQLSLLMYQLVKSFKMKNLNQGIMVMIEVMVKVTVGIIEGSGHRSRLLFRQARKGLDEILQFFALSQVSKSFKKQGDDINELIVNTLNNYN